MQPDPVALAVRENVTWCDLVCRSHRLTPSADARVWWSARRTPDGYPDAITLVPDASELDAIGRIHDTAGASVKDSFACLDLAPSGYRARIDATWLARPPGPAVASGAAGDGFETITDRFRFTAWLHAWGGPADVLRPGLLRTAGVTILGARTPEERFEAGGILHHTTIADTPVVGISNAFGPVARLAAAATARFPDAWIVGYESEPEALIDVGFAPCARLRVWIRA